MFRVSEIISAADQPGDSVPNAGQVNSTGPCQVMGFQLSKNLVWLGMFCWEFCKHVRGQNALKC